MKRSVAVRANIRQVKRAFQQPNGQVDRSNGQVYKSNGQNERAKLCERATRRV